MIKTAPRGARSDDHTHGDGNAIAKNLTWSKWTNQFAEGRGAVSQNDCAPDCAQGHFVDYVADFRLSELVVAGAHRFFTRITITYNGQGPTGQRVEVLKDCWDNPPNPGVPRCPADLQGGQH